MVKLFKYLNKNTLLMFLNDYMEFGTIFPKNKLSLSSAKKNNFTEMQQPIFFLSTGRCGTALITSILENDNKFKVYHNITPTLGEMSVVSFQNKKYINSACMDEMLVKSFLTTREDFFHRVTRFNKIYVETNNRITFLAYEILKVFPNAKFVHMYRNPIEFAISGMRRKWYTKEDSNYYEQIVPLVDNTEWKSYTNLNKISWQWKETNLFIENFLVNVRDQNKLSINFNNLPYGELNKLLSFMGYTKKINVKKILSKKVNEQKSGKFKKYEDWDEDEKKSFQNNCLDLANKYGYKL